jgi:predicted lipid-binding transport protein (Tim44 family)
MQRSQPMKRDAAPSQNPAPAAPQQAGAGRWLAPLAGLAAGIGLSALFSYFGLGEEFSSIVMMLLIAAVAFFVIRVLLRRLRPQAQPLRYAAGSAGTVDYQAPAMGGSAVPANGSSRANVPPGFDVESFAHSAKVNFLRLQAANDAGDIEDIRAFTTPEMFAEIKLQIQERGTAPQKTDVVKLDVELLDVAAEFGQYVASVRFFGNIRETAGSAPEAFDEIWHITKPVDDSRNWAIAGIQQSA